MAVVPEPGFPLAPAPFAGRSRRVEAGASFEWLRHGWALFALTPGLWLAVAGASFLLLLLLLIVPTVGKYALLMFLPLLQAGGLELCRKQSQDKPAAFADLFAGLGARRDALLTLGVLYMAAGLVLRLLAWLLPAGGLFGDLIVTAVLCLPLLAPVAMAAWFAPALVHFHEMAPVPALKASFEACAVNWLAFLVYGVILFVLAFFAALPVMLGFLILLPVFTGALFAAYRDIFPAS